MFFKWSLFFFFPPSQLKYAQAARPPSRRLFASACALALREAEELRGRSCTAHATGGQWLHAQSPVALSG